MKLRKRNINRQPFRGEKVDGVGRRSTLGFQRQQGSEEEEEEEAGMSSVAASTEDVFHAEKRVVDFFRALDKFAAQAVHHAVSSSRASARHIILNLQFLTGSQARQSSILKMKQVSAVQARKR
jgi:hypothetical protein